MDFIIFLTNFFKSISHFCFVINGIFSLFFFIYFFLSILKTYKFLFRLYVWDSDDVNPDILHAGISLLGLFSVVIFLESCYVFMGVVNTFFYHPTLIDDSINIINGHNDKGVPGPFKYENKNYNLYNVDYGTSLSYAGFTMKISNVKLLTCGVMGDVLRQLMLVDYTNIMVQDALKHTEYELPVLPKIPNSATLAERAALEVEINAITVERNAIFARFCNLFTEVGDKEYFKYDKKYVLFHHVFDLVSLHVNARISEISDMLVRIQDNLDNNIYVGEHRTRALAAQMMLETERDTLFQLRSDLINNYKISFFRDFLDVEIKKIVAPQVSVAFGLDYSGIIRPSLLLGGTIVTGVVIGAIAVYGGFI